MQYIVHSLELDVEFLLLNHPQKNSDNIWYINFLNSAFGKMSVII